MDNQFYLGLVERIERLENELRLIRSAPTIPLEIDQAFRGRFQFVSGTGTGSVTTTSIPLSGNAETIVVPNNPSGTLKVLYNGVVYELLYK